MNKYITCPCGRKIKNNYSNIYLHNKTKIHQKYTSRINIRKYILSLFYLNIVEYNLIKDYLFKFANHYFNTRSRIYVYDNYNNLSENNKQLLAKINSDILKLHFNFFNNFMEYIMSHYF